MMDGIPAGVTWREFRRMRKRRSRPLVIAHRGVPVLAPENTLASFALALQQGANLLETDLRMTRDGVIVLMHDETVERTTDGYGTVHTQSLSEVKHLRTLRPDGRPSDQAVPTLIELLAMTQGSVPLLLELKDSRFREYTHAQKLIEILAAYHVLERTAIVSFHHELVSTAKNICPHIPVGEITLYNPIPRPNAELLGPLWPLLVVNPFYVAWAHRMGCIVAPLDPTPEPRMRYYLALGVDAVLSDYPARSIQAMASLRS